jgi:hypothetical protein
VTCIRCGHRDNGTPLCDRCEARVEYEQNLDDELETGRPPAETSRRNPFCWFARLPDAGPCEGRLVKCHLIPRQVIRREYPAAKGLTRSRVRRDLVENLVRESYVTDQRCWVWGCGGAMGPGGHHGKWQPDGPRRIPRELLPLELEEFAAELGLLWYLDRTYGEAENAA